MDPLECNSALMLHLYVRREPTGERRDKKMILRSSRNNTVRHNGTLPRLQNISVYLI